MDGADVKSDDTRSSGTQDRDLTPPSGNEKKDDGNGKKPAVRKRTKTGCLTCRKRRIKCDEGKPTCGNCIKSKRQCEGYNQRVVFKEPINAFHNGPFGHVVFHPQPTARPLNNQHAGAQARASTSQGPLPVIAPKPSNVPFPPSNFSPGFDYMSQPPPPGNLPTHISPTSFGQYEFPPNVSYGQPAHSAPGPTMLPPGINDGYHYSNQMPAALPHTQAFHHFVPEGPDHLSHRNTNTESMQPPRDEVYVDQSGLVQEPYNEDDQYWDVTDYDELMDDSGDEQHHHPPGHLMTNDQGILVYNFLRKRLGSFEEQIGMFSTLQGENSLAGYRPSLANSPLNDEQTAAIFWHFVTVTGPSMSLYERHPIDPVPMFTGEPVPRGKQHIWTYTFPILALNHAALLQAILALGSLQMAKLDGVPAVASLKHYAICLRRLQKNYESPTRRIQPATLAATLLLAFFEVWNSDHDKWCKHMWGARAILKEIPLSEMTSDLLALKRARRYEMEYGMQNPHSGYENPYVYRQGQDTDWDKVDVDLLSQLTGKRVDFSQYSGHVAETSSWRPPKSYTQRDIETYEHVRDLYWWYLKMDTYQSILGGTPLLMEYDLWTQCSPRATIGRTDDMFGTFDHLILLMGRVCSFAARDMSRKRKTTKKPPGGPPGSGPGSASSGHSPPGFPGLMPSSGRVAIPKGFNPPPPPPPSAADEEDEAMDVEARTAAALAEWQAIAGAFAVFEARLGRPFDPLGPQHGGAPLGTPFGPALEFRGYAIAGVWLNFLMARIVLHRAHPSMPPVAMVAAGMAARQTAPDTVRIGRIVAGLLEDCSSVRVVSTMAGAIFIESCFPLFVAAVQYQNHDQRIWTIKRLHDVSRLTGWQSARKMAGGCESAWMKAAKMGRGPPYERPDEIYLEVPRTAFPEPRRILDRIQELDERDERVHLSTSERPSYAFGLLSMEEEMDKLELEDKPKKAR